MYKNFLIIAFVVLMIMGCGTVNTTNELSSSVDAENSLSVDKDELLDKLKNIFVQSGYTFSFEDANKNMLEGERVNITLNDNENIQLFIYGSPDKASVDAERISSDGFLYSKTDGNNGITSSIDWIEAPHFYKNSNIIILYLGSNENILSTLSDNFGDQIAGTK